MSPNAWTVCRMGIAITGSRGRDWRGECVIGLKGFFERERERESLR